MASTRFSDARIVLQPSYSTLSESARWAPFDERLGTGRQYVRVVDSVSCRQMYLRSYTFTRKESISEKTKKYIREVKKNVFGRRFGFRAMRVRTKYEEVSSSTLFSAFRRILHSMDRSR